MHGRFDIGRGQPHDGAKRVLERIERELALLGEAGRDLFGHLVDVVEDRPARFQLEGVRLLLDPRHRNHVDRGRQRRDDEHHRGQQLVMEASADHEGNGLRRAPSRQRVRGFWAILIETNRQIALHSSNDAAKADIGWPQTQFVTIVKILAHSFVRLSPH